MDATLVMVVEDTFEITDRGVVVAPMARDLADLTGASIEVELRRPDGTTRIATARVEAVRFSPWRPGMTIEHALTFPDLHGSDLPVGTEIWTSPALRR